MHLQVVELSPDAQAFLQYQFRRYDANQDSHLSKPEQDEMFSASPSWSAMLCVPASCAHERLLKVYV